MSHSREDRARPDRGATAAAAEAVSGRPAVAAPRRLRITLGGTGMVLLGVIVLVALASPLLAPHDPHALSGAPFLPPGPGHPLGTDDIGHDILSVLLHGTRISVAFGLIAATIAIGVGAVAGLHAGYLGGVVDNVLMRVVDIVLVLPFLPLVLVVGAFLGPGLYTEIAVISAVMWARPARELRAQVLALRSAGWVEASVAMGAGRGHVLFRHLLPGIVPVLVPQFVEATKNAILAEASLSFLGLGDPTTMSWGTLLYHANARGALLTDAWLWWVLPAGLALGLTILALALTGFAVEELAKPRLARGTGRSFAPPERAAVTRREADARVVGQALLEIDRLTITYAGAGGSIAAVDDVRLAIGQGEVVALVGESGSGKTSLAAAVMRVLPGGARVPAGRVLFDGRDLLALSPVAMRALRGGRIALVPQNAMNALNPVIRIGPQIVEAIRAHRNVSAGEAREELGRLLLQVDLAPTVARAFPHELSGGMRQRVAIAMALANTPALIIADEPTTGLDVVAQVELLHLLRRLRDEHATSLILITHDIAVAAGCADRLVVMRNGQLIEEGDTERVVARPAHEYTMRLLAGVPRLTDPVDATALSDAGGYEGTDTSPVPGRGVDRGTGQAVLRVAGLRKTFAGPDGGRHTVLDGIDLEVAAAGITGLVGRSGIGKTTLARIVCGLEQADAGLVHLDGGATSPDGPTPVPRDRRHWLHLIFQDPYEALPPHWRVRDAVAEPLRVRGRESRAERAGRVRATLEAVSLVPADDFLDRYPHELSGGERQRVAFARALISEPRLIVADEPTSLLDAPLRAGLLRLLERLRSEYGIAVLYITHDLALARVFCDRIAILAEGRIVEEGPAQEIIARPRHPRAVELVSAARALDGTR